MIELKSKDTLDEMIGEIFPVSIYFGKWKSNELDRGFSENKHKMSSDQIKLFYSLPTKDAVKYLWIFFEDKVIKTKITGDKIYDGPDELIDEYDSLPKSLDVKLEKLYNKIELPESFSNINSNQGYNRKTISILKNAEEQIADTLCSGNKIKITEENILDYLSPTEFETLLFLIFSNQDVICSSYRGGTLKDFDLRIKVLKDFQGIEKGLHWIQIKYKKEYRSYNDILTIYCGSTDLKNNLIGSDWLVDRIKESKVVKNWLKNMVYDYIVFKYEAL